MCILGLDIGTSGCKASLVSEKGKILSQAYREYSLLSERPGWRELDPEKVWQAVQAVMAESLHKSGGLPVMAIGVSSFGEAVVALDASGAVLGNSMIYIDSRGEAEAEFLRREIGDAKVLAITGTYIQSMYSLCKIMWLKENRPDIYKQTWKFLLFADYILFRLGAAPATDYSLAARTMAFDISKKQWSQEILDCAGIEPKKFAVPVQSGTPVGKISPICAKSLGLGEDVVLVAGGHDQACAALGAGAIRPGLAVDGLGTVECITPVFKLPILTSEMAANHFASVPHVIAGHYVTYAFTFTCGSILKWYRDNLGAQFRQQAEKTGVNAYELMVARANPHPSPVMVLPHFAGAATPYMDTKAQGAIFGLTINTQPQDIIKGILEGITFEIMLNVEKLEAAGVIIDELMAVGGLARSAAFLQLKADMMGKRVATLQEPEAGTVGVAVLAGTAGGLFADIDTAVTRLVRKKNVFYPDRELNEIYREKFQAYKKLYPAVKSLRI